MSDVNYESHYGETGLLIQDRPITPQNPFDYSDTLKISHCSNVIVKNCQIAGGKEDCIDALAGSNLLVLGCILTPNGVNGITLKGGISDVSIADTVWTKHGKNCDIELGQHSIYANPFGTNEITERITLRNLSAADGKPVIVHVWNSERPTVMGGNVKVKMIPKPIVYAYYLFRWVQLHWFK